MLSRAREPKLDPAELFAGLDQARGLLLAVSGGPDSTALLALADRWRRGRAVPVAVAMLLPSLIKVLLPYGFAGWMLIGLIVASIQVIQIPIQTALTLVSASFLAFAYRFFERR